MPDQDNQVHSVEWAESLVWVQATIEPTLPNSIGSHYDLLIKDKNMKKNPGIVCVC